ncbi:response regulator receiver protein (plasmid) [Rhizobium leguminosarum bv. trifolii WSM2304]|uniref:Response regulator receiver protein n=1 Tax=Rhizobium leguminosarum bv. trifolii (strain WSM2304) TaxID=395492 RepID=A0ABF7QUT9_RHILW|nr:response regulator [Rhizobium leguminosarum]ACI57987.1 response regulator receiver protein [Rhizobium leguminosarum bv. trifolii WSM2304]
MYKRTVLIVEDELLIRIVLADTLADEGYDVIEAGNVLEAVAVLGRRKVDAVITDVDMPGGLSGLDLARMISSSDMKVPVIITSGGSIVRPEELPSDTVFMPKPYGMNVISAMVREMTAAETRKMAS